MQKLNNKYLVGAFILLMTGTGCKKDYTNVNAASTEDTFSQDRAATAVATGLQKVYSTTAAGSLYALVDANGFVTNELLLRNAGNIPELQLSTGAVDATNTVTYNIWNKSNKIIYDANNVITFANALQDKNYSSGMISFASIFKALSIGNLSMLWENVPDTIGEQVKFIPRLDGFKKAIAALNNGIAAYNANLPNSLVKSRLPDSTNVINTLYALKARYSLYAGDYAGALAAASLVDLTKRSFFSFEPLNQNPVFESATSTNNVFQPIDSTLGLPVALAPDLADKRIAFFIGINAATAPRYRIKGYYATNISIVPFYTAGELMLIKAEAYARQATPDLTSALAELNKVVTKTPASDAYGVGADLPPIAGPLTQADLLTQIYRHRCIELFMTGLKLEDMRRFGRPNAERKRNFFPYPFQERDNNPNTPADPAF